jgi:citrate lyase subunit alpha/citrate CoA-transferase
MGGIMSRLKNALGREVPTEVNGRKVKPFMGVGKFRPAGHKAGPPIPTGADYKHKVVKSLDEVIDRLEVKNGMTLSFHHHLRNGDTSLMKRVRIDIR